NGLSATGGRSALKQRDPHSVPPPRRGDGLRAADEACRAAAGAGHVAFRGSSGLVGDDGCRTTSAGYRPCDGRYRGGGELALLTVLLWLLLLDPPGDAGLYVGWRLPSKPLCENGLSGGVGRGAPTGG
ncbi:hypothetical protein DIPPA_05474, partial [Diplonema papillatum]